MALFPCSDQKSPLPGVFWHQNSIFTVSRLSTTAAIRKILPVTAAFGGSPEVWEPSAKDRAF